MRSIRPASLAKPTKLASGASATVETFAGAAISGGKVEAMSGGTAIVSAATIAADAIVETLAGGTALVRGATHNSGGTLFASGASSLIEIVSGAVVSGGPVEVGNGNVDVLSGGTAMAARSFRKCRPTNSNRCWRVRAGSDRRQISAR
jgi:hypothetical protein